MGIMGSMIEPLLTTERLMLRDLREEDWRTIHAYCSLPEIRRNILPRTATVAGARRLVLDAIAQAGKKPRLFYALGLVPKLEGRLIGTCVLNNALPGGAAWIGWDLDRAYWGQGLMTEAARSVIDFGFRECGVACICADGFRGNRASIRVMEKVGMRRQKLPVLDELKLARYYGVWRRYVRYCLPVTEWQAALR
jgi:ribosomal-protein-alanine N-acetyltransferase